MRKSFIIWPGVLLLAWFSMSSGQTLAQEQEEPSWEVLDERAAQGEQCLVCGQAIREGEVVQIRYKGRTFFVAAKMLEAFEGSPDTFFQKLQANAALFDEGSLPDRQISNFWLGFGLYVLAGLLAAASSGYIAVSKGIDSLPWFVAGLLLNVLAVIAVALLPRAVTDSPAGIPLGLAKVPVTRQPVSCLHCGDPNHPAAAACSGCGGVLEPMVEPETARA